jgi:dinuclear metal center YbgI/SA1388 family protein
MKRSELLALLNHLLQPDSFRDVAENGLQVSGADHIETVVCGVSANRQLIEHAIAENAQAIFVHHGLVWGGGIRSITGWLHERLRLLLQHNISLFAYHLPLDAHLTLGNNVGLANALGIQAGLAPFGMYKGQAIGLRGSFETPITHADLLARVEKNVGPPVCAFGKQDQKVSQIGICTGAAPDLLHEAIECGLDAYITGEATEWVKSVAEESGLSFVAGGHHATERFGAKRIAAMLRSDHSLQATFFDVENPV